LCVAAVAAAVVALLDCIFQGFDLGRAEISPTARLREHIAQFASTGVAPGSAVVASAAATGAHGQQRRRPQAGGLYKCISSHARLLLTVRSTLPAEQEDRAECIE